MAMIASKCPRIKVTILAVWSIISVAATHVCGSVFEVTVVDLNATRIAQWNSKDLPIFEPGLDDVVQV